MKKELFVKPWFVKEAAENQKGMFWLLEMLVFVVVFWVCQMAMSVFMTPATLVMMFTNPNYLTAIQAGDIESILNLSMEISTSSTYILVMLFSEIMMILVACLFCKLIQKRKMGTLGFVKKNALKEYLIGAAVGFGIFSVAVLGSVMTGSMKIVGFSKDFSAISVILFLLGFLIQGMAEEVICRSYLMVSIARRYPLWVAIGLNAFTFAALHLMNNGITWLSFVNLILFGVFASVYFLRRGSIWGIGALHSIWNWVQGNFYGISVSGNQVGSSVLTTESIAGKEFLNGGAFGLEGSIMVTIVLAVGIVVLCFWKKAEAEPAAN